MKKNTLALTLGTIIAITALSACGGSSSSAATAAPASQAPASEEETTIEEAAPEEPAERIHLTIGVTGSVYDDLWAPAIETLAEQGIDLETVQFSDYVTPNNALANGETDLNGFQHRIYLASEIEQYGYGITNIGNTFISPMNLYSEHVSSLEELKDGDVIAIPNDPTNGGRAIKVLQDAGLIVLNSDAGFSPTLDDIETYNVGITIEELAANTIPSVLPDVAAAIINGNYALDFGLDVDTAIFHDKMNEEEYWNLIACRTEDLSDPKLVEAYDKVVKAYQSEGTKKVYDEDFGGYYVGVGWGVDLLADYK